jgi:hypothetical protein
MYTPRLGVLGLHKRTLAAVAAVGIVALLALAASMALMQPATVAPKGGTADSIGLKGMVEITVRDAQGNVKHHEVVPNAIVTQGLEKLIVNTFAAGTQVPSVTYITFVATDPGRVYTPHATLLTDPTEVDEDGEYYVSSVLSLGLPSGTYRGVQIKACASGAGLGISSGTITVDYLLVTNSHSYDVITGTHTITISGAAANTQLNFDIDSSDAVDEASIVFSALPTSIQLGPSDTLTVTWTLGLAAS